MCIELPGRVVELPADRPDIARVEVDGVVRAIHLGLLDAGPLAVGDWLAIHLGFAVERMTEEEVDEEFAAKALLRGGDDDNPFAGLLFDSPYPPGTDAEPIEGTPA